jgi:hypothetical protein
MDLNDFIETLSTVYESHTGETCTLDHDALVEVHDLLDDDTDVEALKAAFEEAGIDTDEFEDDFFSDLSIELRELVS